MLTRIITINHLNNNNNVWATADIQMAVESLHIPDWAITKSEDTSIGPRDLNVCVCAFVHSLQTYALTIVYDYLQTSH